MDSVLVTRGLTKDFGSFRAVDGLDLTVNRGEVYGFLGRNGAGKTTTIRMILGLIHPTAGQVLLWGRPLGPRSLAKMGSLVEASSAYPNLTVRENLELHARLTGVGAQAVGEVMGLLSLEEYAHRRAGRLSLGNRQRLSLARALVASPELIILDEPVNGLDPAGIVEIRTLIRTLADRGTTVFLSSHQLDEVALVADRVGIVHQGRLVEEFDRSSLQRVKPLSLEVEVDDVVRAQAVLQNVLGVVAQTTGPRTLVVTEPVQASAVARVLVEAGMALERLEPKTEGLEQRFLRLTGGGS